MTRVLIPDSWHFHRRNFAALFDALRADGIPWWRSRARRRWWKRHGDYRAFAGRLAPHLRRLEPLDAEALIELRHAGVPVFACARSELMCLLLPRPGWRDGGYANDAATVLRRAIADPEDRRDLLLCMAAACDWIDHWTALLRRRGPFTHALAFSGSYIYTRTLQEVGRAAGLRLFALESFFTGNEFYFEERATPLANRSQLGDPAFRARLALPQDQDLRDRLRAEAQRRLAAMRNKNVKVAVGQPVPPPFPGSSAGTVLIVGQVLNDFSLIETPSAEASSLATYRRLITGILERTDRNVVFKAHPWERRRPGLRRPLTLELLQETAAALPPGQRARLRLVEREPISGLFPHVEHAVGLCSQGLLEACQAGLKPVQLGHAFFGGQGFTHDYADPDAFVADLAAGRVAGALELDEYRLFEDFLVRALVLHLVPNAREGVDKIRARLAAPDAVADPAALAAALPEPSSGAPLRDWIVEIAQNPLPWLRRLARL